VVHVPIPNVRSGKREQNALRNRSAILRAAHEAFCEIGFGATTVRNIIRRTDLATGTFYNYFPDKEALLHELIGEFQLELRRRVHEAREAAETLEDLLRSAFAMQKNERLTRSQMLRAANAPMLAKKAMDEGDPVHGYLPSGSVAGLIDDIPTCEELVNGIIREAEQTLAALAN
jgi:AcrR family transcriptional regulator